MKSLILLIALMSFSSHAYAQASTCESLFTDRITVDDIIFSGAENMYSDTQLTRDEFYGLMHDHYARERAKPNPQSIRDLLVRHGNKVASYQGQVVRIESAMSQGNKVYEKQFPDNINNVGYFEETTGKYWIMPHNPGHVLIWNYTKNQTLDIKLPENSKMESIDFDFADIYQPKVIIGYEQHGKSSQPQSKDMTINLLTGKEI